MGVLCAVLAIGLTLLAGTAQARYASIVIDFETGKTLHQTNADTRNYPASLTKMMTLYLAFEALERGRLKLRQKLPVSRRAAGMPPSRLGLKPGDTITVEEVILALVTKSANDAAVVMAEALGTSEARFAKMMTKKARMLGMKRTTFRNASGLPNRGQRSTARDMAKLARALISDHPDRYEYFATESFTFRGRSYRNHNNLLKRYKGTDGIKTGYIRASGFNLTASAVRNGRRLIAVVFGGKTPRSRDRHIADLLDRGFTRVAHLGPNRPYLLTLPRSGKPTRQLAGAGQLKALSALPRPRVKPLIGIAGAAGSAPAARSTMPVSAASVVAAISGERTWGIQVGAFYSQEQAEDAAVDAVSRAPEFLDRSMIFVPRINGRRGQIHRARLVGITERDAHSACEQLSKLKADCLVVRAHEALASNDLSAPVATN